MNNLVELNELELQSVNGGLIGIDDIIAGFIVACVVDIINDPEGFESGVKDGYCAVNPDSPSCWGGASGSW